MFEEPIGDGQGEVHLITQVRPYEIPKKLSKSALFELFVKKLREVQNRHKFKAEIPVEFRGVDLTRRRVVPKSK